MPSPDPAATLPPPGAFSGATRDRTTPQPSSLPAQPTTSRPAAGRGEPIAAANPFSGVPLSDYLRDGVSAVAAFTALGVFWQVGGFYDDFGDIKINGGDYWWVVLSALLSVASLAVPYVQRMKVAPILGPREVRLIKFAANTPAFTSVLVALVAALTRALDDSDASFGGGVTMLTLAAALAVTPRVSDDDGGVHDQLWFTAARVVGGAAITVAAVTTLRFLIFTDGAWDDSVLGTIGGTVLTAGVFAVTVGVPIALAFGHRFGPTAVLVAVGASMVATELLATMGDPSAFVGANGTLTGEVSASLFLVGATAALFSSRPVYRMLAVAHPVDRWLESARWASLVTAGYAVITVIGGVLTASAYQGWGGKQVTFQVLLAVVAGAAGLASNLLATNAAANRQLVVLIQGGILVLAIVAVIVGNSAGAQFDALDTAGLFGLPLLAMGALTVPKPVREHFGPLYTPSVPQTPGQPPVQ